MYLIIFNVSYKYNCLGFTKTFSVLIKKVHYQVILSTGKTSQNCWLRKGDSKVQRKKIYLLYYTKTSYFGRLLKIVG